MKSSQIDRPSNRKFGFLFALVFAFVAAYFYDTEPSFWPHLSATGSVILLVVTLVKADLLLPLNHLWMRFGVFLGMVVGPMVLGIIFFGLFTPIAFVMRFGGRDELRLKCKKKSSYWVLRSEPIKPGSFKLQF